MRVLTVLDAFRLGGAETLVAQLGRVAPAADLELDVLSLHGPSPENSKLEPMLTEVGLTPHYLGARRTLDPVAFRRLVSYIRRTRPDVVHAHLEMAISMVVPAARLARVPVLGTFHQVHRALTGREAARERLAVEVATRSDGAIFVSDASRVSFADRYRPGRDIPSSWLVVHNGIDVDHFSPTADGTRPPLPPDLLDAVITRAQTDADPSRSVRLVTIVAALRGFKGILHALRAWPIVLDRHPDARLLLVGTGDQEASLRAEVARLRLGESVIFAGMRTDIPEVMRASEIVVLPSVYGENLPTVLMEAGACGRPVVASDVGGISDIVTDGVTGLLAAPGDSAGVARAVNELLDDPARADALGRAARERIVTRFSAGVWAANLREVYQRAIDGHRRPPARSEHASELGADRRSDMLGNRPSGTLAEAVQR